MRRGCRKGATDGPPGTTLDRIQAVAELPGGGLVLADDGGTIIRAYDAAGRHLRSSGHAGDGPGEYRRIIGMWWLPGGSLAVYDRQTMRLSPLDPELRYVRSLRLDLPVARGFLDVVKSGRRGGPRKPPNAGRSWKERGTAA